MGARVWVPVFSVSEVCQMAESGLAHRGLRAQALVELASQRRAKIFRRKDLPDFDLAILSVRLGAALDPSIASSFEFTCHNQKRRRDPLSLRRDRQSHCVCRRRILRARLWMLDAGPRLRAVLRRSRALR